MQKTAFEIGFETGLTKLGAGWQDYLGQAYNWLKSQPWLKEVWNNPWLRSTLGGLGGGALGGLIGGRKGALLGGGLGLAGGYFSKGLSEQPWAAKQLDTIKGYGKFIDADKAIREEQKNMPPEKDPTEMSIFPGWK